MHLNKLLLFVICSIVIMLIGCRHVQTIKFETDIENNDKHTILFETFVGCQETKFKYNENYFFDLKNNDCFIAKIFTEFNNIIKKYFKMDFFETITNEYFNQYNPIILKVGITGNQFIKNIIIEKSKNNKYLFLVNIYKKIRLSEPDCFKDCIYIIQVEK